MKDLREVSPRGKKILILSPHPDDDCLGMGATISFLRKDNYLKIFYLTSGWRGVRGRISREEKSNLREREAISAVKLLGIDEKAVRFLSLPFYEKGEVCSRDILILTEEIKRFRPQIIFTSAEEEDPHLTHKKCWQIVRESLKDLDFSFSIYIYQVWEIFRKFDYFFSFGKRLMERKLKAIKEHRSQLKPKYTKRGITSLGEWEVSLNRNYAKMLGKGFLYAEVFKTCPDNPEEDGYFRDEEGEVYKVMD
ncbi:MAG: PIG-L family deacetylase [Candidatus Omnitrophica bacterium]|nr:PIG-L family deacetylase [Candidatus Omnitrophota bacterium]MCM8793767.1 PIG-L family deacetylase [Candidatus Omnitrophota bacterium]